MAESGWPVEPGDYVIGDPSSSIAISTLSDEEFLKQLASRLARNKYAILGVTRTRNIGVEKLVRNIAANPHITRLILAGRDSSTSPVAPVIMELSRHGISGDGSVRVQGREVRLRNLSADDVDEFRSRVRIIDMSGVRDAEVLLNLVEGLEQPPHQPTAGHRYAGTDYARITAQDDDQVVLDDRGFFIIYIDRGNGRIICEHYDTSGRKTAEISGSTARAIYKTVVRMGLLSRLDHAAYLGRELARAECALAEGSEYVQDRA
ncbi:DUF4346 domain-containing protein [Conexivisphaera calida]|uniref:DUF4346 domain-containing protein n=1 Tax=Conexivisphaera calida TaxID=1874277 RepID=UPI001E39B8E4|nr:DUF4346 domain-containing protein [Conexivisphaera calida]